MFSHVNRQTHGCKMDALMFAIVAWLTVIKHSFHLIYFCNLQYSQVKSRMGIDFILTESFNSMTIPIAIYVCCVNWGSLLFCCVQCIPRLHVLKTNRTGLNMYVKLSRSVPSIYGGHSKSQSTFPKPLQPNTRANGTLTTRINPNQ